MRNVFGKLLFPALVGGVLLLLACDGGDSPSDPREGGSNEEYNAFTDKRDGNVYRVVEVGDRTWMAENLRYRDVKADPILEDNSWCVSGDKKKCEKEGYLYSWAAVMLDSSCAKSKCDVVYPHRGICPEGWHVAENYEWQELFELAAGQDLLLVEYPEFNWSPTGMFNADEDLLMDSDGSYYWTSSTRTSDEAFVWLIEDDLADFFHIESVKDNGFAVRCVAKTVDVKLDKYVEFEIPERPSTPKSSSSRKAYSSSSSVSERSSSSYIIDVSYVTEGGLNAFTDKRDGNVYRVISVGPQIWMADNLRYNDTAASPALKSYSWCIGSGDDCGKDGYLYDFATVMDVPECAYSLCEFSLPHRGICPEGWHVPSYDEWDFLLIEADALGVPLDSYLGFPSAPTGEHGSKTTMDHCARYWTASQANAEASYEYYRCGSDPKFYSQNYSKSYGYALRCVADSGEVKLDKYIIPEDPSSSSVESSSSTPRYSCDYACNSSSSSSSTPQYSCDYSCFSSSSSMPVAKALEPFVDARDGNEYGAVQVENLIWMTENLRYADSAATPALKGNTVCVADGCEKGNLYTYSAAVGDSKCATEVCFASDGAVQGICPKKWRLPTRLDWQSLAKMVNANQDIHAALAFIPTGEREGNGNRRNDSYARFWLANEDGSESAYEGYNEVWSFALKLQSYLKTYGYAVRCVMDAGYMSD